MRAELGTYNDKRQNPLDKNPYHAYGGCEAWGYRMTGSTGTRSGQAAARVLGQGRPDSADAGHRHGPAGLVRPSRCGSLVTELVNVRAQSAKSEVRMKKGGRGKELRD